MPIVPATARRKFLKDLAIAVPFLPVARLEAGSWRATLIGPDEPGPRLTVSGTVVRPDGAPARGIRLSVYHTDAEGYYSRPVSDPRRARIRGSVVTGPEGQYAFHTIQPGRYPNFEQAAHIHVHVAGPGYPEHWIDSFLFEGDPHQRPDDVARSRAADAFGQVMPLRRDGQGLWQARRDIRLDPTLAERNRLVDGWYRQ